MGHAVRLAPWPGHGDWCTMRFGSAAKVLAKCKLKYCRIAECGWADPKKKTNQMLWALHRNESCDEGGKPLRRLPCERVKRLAESLTHGPCSEDYGQGWP